MFEILCTNRLLPNTRILSKRWKLQVRHKQETREDGTGKKTRETKITTDLKSNIHYDSQKFDDLPSLSIHSFERCLERKLKIRYEKNLHRMLNCVTAFPMNNNPEKKTFRCHLNTCRCVVFNGYWKKRKIMNWRIPKSTFIYIKQQTILFAFFPSSVNGNE